MAGSKLPGVSNHALRHTRPPLWGISIRATCGRSRSCSARESEDDRARYSHVVDMAKKNPVLFIPVKVG
jgi:hypothetical protein